jgi:hypothetical protein
VQETMALVFSKAVLRLIHDVRSDAREAPNLLCIPVILRGHGKFHGFLMEGTYLFPTPSISKDTVIPFPGKIRRSGGH